MFPLLSFPLRTFALVASIALLTIVVAAAPTTTSIAGYTDPTKLGNGSWFLDAGNGLGEPLNVRVNPPLCVLFLTRRAGRHIR